MAVLQLWKQCRGSSGTSMMEAVCCCHCNCCAPNDGSCACPKQSGGMACVPKLASFPHLCLPASRHHLGVIWALQRSAGGRDPSTWTLYSTRAR